MQTIGELAKSLGVSKTAVNNKIDKLGIRDNIQKQDGVYLLTEEQAAKVAQTFKKIRTDNFTGNFAGDHSGTDNEPTTKTQGFAETLCAQLAAKDEEIRRLHEEIRELHKLLDQQQQLTMATQQKQIKALEDKQQQKRGLFGWLFRKPEPATESDQKGEQEQ